MGASRERARSSAGFSMIEVMIAGAMLAFIAIALMPAVFSVMDQGKGQGFHAVCTSAVRAKIQEYMNGVANSDAGTNSYVPTGFEYTKSKWKATGYGYDNCSLSPSAAAPGYREAVYGNQLQSGQELAPSSTSPAVMLGFQLYVMMRHYNPRVLLHNQPTRDCADANYQFFQVGDGIEVTVTGMVRTDSAVLSGGRGGVPVGKLYDSGHSDGPPPVSGTAPNPRLTCSVTEIIYPPRVPFRYFLGSDGKIRNFQSSIAYMANPATVGIQRLAMESHFRNVWLQRDTGSSSDKPLANILSFAVSPNNQWVYVLRPGELSRYGPCYSTQTSVTVNGSAQLVGGNQSVDGVGFVGVPNCPSLPSRTATVASPNPDGTFWTSKNLNIESIAVDFGADLTSTSDDLVYGLFNTGAGAMQRTGYTTQSGLMLADLATTPDVVSGKYLASFYESTTFRLPANRPRIKGMYFAQMAPSNTTSAPPPSLFFFDNTCYAGSSTSSASGNCASIFSSGDTTMSQVMRDLPTQVEALSY